MLVAIGVIYQLQVGDIELGTAKAYWFAIADFVEHIVFQQYGEQQSCEFVGLKISKVDTRRKVGSDSEWLNILIPVCISIRYWYQAFLCKQLLIVKVKFSACDKALLIVKIESTMTWFGGI